MDVPEIACEDTTWVELARDHAYQLALILVVLDLRFLLLQ
jgi:hypothetical protein